MKKVIAIVGCGRIARNAHLPALSGLENVRVKYACDIILEKAEQLKADFPVIENTVDDPEHWYGVKFESVLPELIRTLN